MRIIDESPEEVGSQGASVVAAGLLHPLTPTGKLIWRGLEGLASTKVLLKAAQDAAPNGKFVKPFIILCCTP